MAETPPRSSDSPAECSESVGSSSLSVEDRPARGSKSGFTQRDFVMAPPEEKLKHFDGRAQAHEDNQEFDACLRDLVRCVALTRLVYGEGHLKVAQAHARLAKAYLQLKGWGLQAQEHSSLAREMLPACSSVSSCRGEKLRCLLSIHLTQGGAALLTTNLEEAESSFLGAERVLKDLHQHSAIDQEDETKTALEISTSLCSPLSGLCGCLVMVLQNCWVEFLLRLQRVYKRQSRPDEALNQCEKSLQLLKDCEKPDKTCSVYRDMAAIEQDKGHMDQAIEHLSKAHAIAMRHSPGELEEAQISLSLALIHSAAAEPHHNESAARYFEQSLNAYKNSVGPQDPAFLTAQDDFCRFLLLNHQQERCVAIQRTSLTPKRSAFGDLSAEVADTLQLIGSVEMSEGRMMQAHRTMSKCLETQNWLYGPQHKKTKATQKAVDMLARAPEVAARLQKQSRRKT